MRTCLYLLAAALLLACVPLACRVAVLWTEREAEPPGVRESRAAVIRQARAGLDNVRRRNGYGDPETWSETDQEVYRNHVNALRREGEAP